MYYIKSSRMLMLCNTSNPNPISESKKPTKSDQGGCRGREGFIFSGKRVGLNHIFLERTLNCLEMHANQNVLMMDIHSKTHLSDKHWETIFCRFRHNIRLNK